jgi:murein L,D-transpeptidase YcbB/YkuD
MGYAIEAWLSGVAVVALMAGLSGARAEDAGLPAIPEAAAVMEVRNVAAALDYRPIGSASVNSVVVMEPQLPAETRPLSSADAATPPTATEQLPFAIQALIDRPGGLPALSAGDWRAAREALRLFYFERQFAPAWTDASGFNAAGRSAWARIAEAGEDGLDLKGLILPAANFSTADSDKLAEADVELSIAIAVYALEASGARIKPTSISPYVTAHADVVDPAAALASVAAAADPGDALQDFNPPQEGYRRLRVKLSQLPAPRLAPRANGTAVSLIGARSFVEVAAPARPRKNIVAAGAVADALTVAVNADAESQRRAAILANMEMWRWEPRDMGRDRIEVNVPDYTLHLYQNDAETDRTRVIVGKPQTPTPIFSNAVKYLLVNPIWRIPDSILRKELMPHFAADPGYFTRLGYTVKYVGSQMFVEQPPGEDNALGRILFMFPNQHAVYLHDTPAKGLFAAARRAFSHGCVRVEQPMRLAVEVMGGAAHGWTTERVESLFGPNERAVFTPTPVPIHIEYFTEFVDDSGALREREDVYGLTARVAATLLRLSQD